MGRLLKTAVLILIVLVGSWILFNRQNIKSPSDLVDLARRGLVSLKLPGWRDSSPTKRQSASLFCKSPDTIRIASFKLNGKTGAAQQPDALRLMTHICSQFDVIAMQNVNPQDSEWLVNLTGALNSATDTEFRFVLSPIADERQFATIFNAKTLELDRARAYTVNDPDDLFTREPFVCWFRVCNVDQAKAFTFSLASIQVDSARSGIELDQLGNLYRAIREDGRGEDDVIFVGDFQTGGRRLAAIEEQTGLRSVLPNSPTNTLGTAQFDNVLFSPVATVEFSGSAGVFDFMKQYNLYLSDALRISEHLPVWGDFSIYEGTGPGRVAVDIQLKQPRIE